MKRIALIGLAAILMLIPLVGVSCSGEDGDTAAIKDVINSMWDAYDQGDYAKVLTYCTNYGDEDDQIAQMTLTKSLMGNFTVQSIENINISDSSATANVTLLVGGQTDTDEVKFIKIDGSWKVNQDIPPAANFTASATTGYFPIVIQFTDESVGQISAWAWDFDNDGTVDSTEQSPNYTYDSPGVYTVSLTVNQNNLLDTETKTDYINASPPEPNFTASPTNGGSPLAIQFTDESVGQISAWAWDFDNDGTVDSTEQSPAYTYEVSGTYTVSLTITQSDLSYTETKTDYINVFAWSAMSSGTTRYLNGIWGSSSSNVFAVGDDGTILHYDGTSWSAMSSGTTEQLLGVWGSSSSDVFAVGGNGTIIHYDSTSWSAMSSGTTEHLLGVWGSSSSDVFAVGYASGHMEGDAIILHYDGTSWSDVSYGTIEWLEHFGGIWGSSSSDIYAVGGHNIILYYDGTNWSETSVVWGDILYDVWGSSSSNVFAVGDFGTILHYDGNSWSDMRGNIESEFIYGVWGSSSSDVYAVGYNWEDSTGFILHYDGNSWNEMSIYVTEGLTGVWGSSASDVFAVGRNGTILHCHCTVQ